MFIDVIMKGKVFANHNIYIGMCMVHFQFADIKNTNIVLVLGMSITYTIIYYILPRILHYTILYYVLIYLYRL